MVKEKVKVINKSGLHLRPAGVLTEVARGCKSEVFLIKEDGTRVNPKSVLFLMGANITCGMEITVECSGMTEEEDLKAIIEAIKSGLNEE
ncbi:PTS beta-glucoside transporter subunit IIABC [Sporanaerobium hydrogeniformans]|uniref:PTS beta-glucoside transporter subunit IIABC n=1 Tax=Sporanaerobium hydrogeniformans TaxID=3072179 RepID=A0AC61D9V4_9FIRM|nr:HPr family phosphocarrier protein [Sporanaerobium hydrogeniformans]PHV69650.1 PTS beta-glucoside transporter subunit IIABC [Sporanaerobium hydrogeniformans]